MKLPGVNHKRTQADEARENKNWNSQLFGEKFGEEKTGKGKDHNCDKLVDRGDVKNCDTLVDEVTNNR